MSRATLGSDRMADPLRERRVALDRYAALVRRLGGRNLLSLAVHGPALDPHARVEHVDTVVVLAEDDLSLLRALSRFGPQLDQDGIAAPLIMTPATIASSRDTFPLELLDIAQRHVLVIGEDRFAGLALEREHVRLQCERDLKSIATALRQRILRVGGVEKALTLEDLVEGAVRVARGLLLLAGAPSARASDDVVTALERSGGREFPAIKAAAAGARGWDAYVAFYREIRVLEGSAESATASGSSGASIDTAGDDGSSAKRTARA